MGCVEARCASARPDEIVLPVPTADASTPDPTTFSAAISRWRPSSTGSSAKGRASVIRTTWRAPADSVTFAWERLSATSAPSACSATTRRVVADTPSELVIVSIPGPSLHPPDPDGVLQLAGRLGREQQRQPRVDRRLHRLAEIHHRARVRVLLLARRRPEPPLAEPARRERQHPQLELGRRRAVGALVGAAVDGEPAPAVALVARHARADRGTRSSRESSCASWPAESRHSRGPAWSVWTLIRSSSASRLPIGITAERRSRSSRPPSSAISRIVSSASTGVSCHPSLDPIAGTTNTPTGRSTLPTAPSRSPASDNQVVRADPPAAQVAGVELAGVGEQPPRQVVG